MNATLVRRLLGRLLVFLGLLMLIPLAVALGYGDGGGFHEIPAFLGAIGICSLLGAGLAGFRQEFPRSLTQREGFLVVALSWLALALFGSLPFCLAERVFTLGGEPAPGLFGSLAAGDPLGALDVFTHAVFEAISGFTTTGATVLTDIERLPHGLLFWRAFTHWLGGMGIVLLGVAILPSLGVGGYQLARAEVPGPTMDKLQPRIAETARLLWTVYLALTVAQTLLLWIFGMSLFEAVCHTFATLATGGFSTRNASIAAFPSPAIQWTLIVFMAMAGMNFVLHYQVLWERKLTAYFKDLEWWSLITMFGVLTLLLAWPLHGQDATWGLERALRASAFQVVSITTTTGFCTEDFDLWGTGARLVLVMLMFVGGCAGSTAGGLKQIRFIVLFKALVRQLKQLLQPRAVFSVKVQGKPVPEEMIAGVMVLFFAYTTLFALAALALAMLIHLPGRTAGYQLETAFTASIACVGNIGPGLAGVGATQNYQFIPALGKWILVFCMIAGRLEIYSLLVLMLPQAWER